MSFDLGNDLGSSLDEVKEVKKSPSGKILSPSKSKSKNATDDEKVMNFINSNPTYSIITADRVYQIPTKELFALSKDPETSLRTIASSEEATAERALPMFNNYVVSQLKAFIAFHATNPYKQKESYNSKDKLETIVSKPDAIFIENVADVGMDQLFSLRSLAVEFGITDLVALCNLYKEQYADKLFEETKDDDDDDFFSKTAYFSDFACADWESLRNLDEMEKIKTSDPKKYAILKYVIESRFSGLGLKVDVPSSDEKSFATKMKALRKEIKEGSIATAMNGIRKDFYAKKQVELNDSILHDEAEREVNVKLLKEKNEIRAIIENMENAKDEDKYKELGKTLIGMFPLANVEEEIPPFKSPKFKELMTEFKKSMTYGTLYTAEQKGRITAIFDKKKKGAK